MGQIKWMAAFLMTALFAIAIISYTIGFTNDNDSSTNLDGEGFDSMNSNLNANVQTFKSQSNSTSEAFFEASVESGDDTTRTGGQFKGTVSGTFSAVKNVLSLGNEKIFGSDSQFGIILTGLISFIGVVTFFYVWKTWKGNPD